MIALQQRYQRQSRLLLAAVAAMVVLMVGVGFTAWPSIQRSLGQAAVTCGCGIVRVHLSTWPTIAAGSIFSFGALVILTSLGRFWWLARQARRYQRALERFGTRTVRYEPFQTTYRLVQTEEHLAVTVGWWRPVVYLSKGTLRALQGSEVRAVLAHERAHQLARDPFVASLTDSLTWLLRWLPGGREWARQASTWRELAADAAATNGYQSIAALSSAFLKFHQTAHPVGAGFSANSDRLEKLVNRNWHPTWTGWRWAAPIMAGVVIVGTIMLGRFVQAATPPAPVVAQACYETIVRCEQPHTQIPSTTIRCSTSSCVTEDRHASPVYGLSR